jgi:hypothetical protein
LSGLCFYSAIETVFRPAERRLDARTQLARAEGLGYVILRAKFQVQNFFGFGGVLVALIGLLRQAALNDNAQARRRPLPAT